MLETFAMVANPEVPGMDMSDPNVRRLSGSVAGTSKRAKQEASEVGSEKCEGRYRRRAWEHLGLAGRARSIRTRVLPLQDI